MSNPRGGRLVKNKEIDNDSMLLITNVIDTVKAAEVPIVEESVIEAPKIKLNLGCGFRKVDGFINIDKRELVKPELLADIEDGFPMYADSSVDEVRAFDILEHIVPDKVVFVLSEIHRILKSEGVFHFFIPSTDGRGAFQDPTHRSYWNINSWLYYCAPTWHDLYPELPFFKSLGIKDVGENVYKIIHTEGFLQPVK